MFLLEVGQRSRVVDSNVRVRVGEEDMCIERTHNVGARRRTNIMCPLYVLD